MPGNQGISRLAEVLQHIAAEAAFRPDDLDLGTIQPDGSLRLDRFGVPIPPGEYLVLRHLTLPDPMCYVTVEGVQYPVPRPAELAPPGPGDRVLCLWLNGTEVVVLGVVTRA